MPLQNKLVSLNLGFAIEPKIAAPKYIKRGTNNLCYQGTFRMRKTINNFMIKHYPGTNDHSFTNSPRCSIEAKRNRDGFTE